MTSVLLRLDVLAQAQAPNNSPLFLPHTCTLVIFAYLSFHVLGLSTQA